VESRPDAGVGYLRDGGVEGDEGVLVNDWPCRVLKYEIGRGPGILNPGPHGPEPRVGAVPSCVRQTPASSSRIRNRTAWCPLVTSSSHPKPGMRDTAVMLAAPGGFSGIG
jgi:hypothetical protein